MLELTGDADAKDLELVIPSPERRKKGAVAVIECFQRIPCNPCAAACSIGAIKPFKNINDRPEIDYDRCTGCGMCMSRCPGLAIFIVDETYSDSEALVSIPYEFLPLPEVGSTVSGLNREGSPICSVRVVKVKNAAYQEKTPVVTLAVPMQFSMEVRFFREEILNDSTIICRCEDITLGEIREYIRKGYTDLNVIKKLTRAGMGPCQGKTCSNLILQEIAKATRSNISDIKIPASRPPAKPVKMGFFLGGDDDE